MTDGAGDSDVLDQWLRGIRTLHIAHAKAAARFRRRGRVLGVPVVVLTAIVGTSIFATLSEEPPSDTWKIVAGILAAVAAVLSALQTFLNYGVLAEQHKVADLAFGALRRSFERSLDARPLSQEQRAIVMQEVGDAWSQIEREAPVVPDDLYRRALKSTTRGGSQVAARRPG